MAAEYSAIAAQNVAVDENILFDNGCRACRKGFIQHRDDSGIFFLKGSLRIYTKKVHFANLEMVHLRQKKAFDSSSFRACAFLLFDSWQVLT